jgi:hypothetical protein
MAMDQMQKDHQRFFEGFVKFAAYACVAAAVTLGLMALFLV